MLPAECITETFNCEHALLVVHAAGQKGRFHIGPNAGAFISAPSHPDPSPREVPAQSLSRNPGRPQGGASRPGNAVRFSALVLRRSQSQGIPGRHTI